MVADETRKLLIETERLIEVLRTLAFDTSHNDPRVYKYARRTLGILGMLDKVPESRGLRILSLDGGGSRGVTTVELLRKIEQMTGKKIWELFDLIGGTSAGGLTASCLAFRHFSLDRIKVLQERLCYEVRLF